MLFFVFYCRRSGAWHCGSVQGGVEPSEGEGGTSGQRKTGQGGAQEDDAAQRREGTFARRAPGATSIQINVPPSQCFTPKHHPLLLPRNPKHKHIV